jgi:hypothetical protein
MDEAGNVGTAEWTISSEPGLFVGSTSWLALAAVVVIVSAVLVAYLWTRSRRQAQR